MTRQAVRTGAVIEFGTAREAQRPVAGVPVAARILHQLAEAGFSEAWIELADGHPLDPATLAEIGRLAPEMAVRVDSPASEAGPIVRFPADRLIEAAAIPDFIAGKPYPFKRLDSPDAAAEILPTAEAAGVLHEIDSRVLRLAIAILERRSAESRPVRLFVSQSARTLVREGYAASVLESLAGTAIDGPSLVIDVRQDEALVHALALQEFCDAMVPAGVQLCLSQYATTPESDALIARLAEEAK